MFEKLIGIVVDIWDWLIPFQIVDQYESGIHMRLGKFYRVLEPGLRFRWWAVDTFSVINVATTTMPLRAQSLTTKDGKAVVVSSILKYRIIDVKPTMLELWDAEDVLRDTAMGAVKDVVSERTLKRLNEKSTEQRVMDIIQGELADYGVEVHRITFVDLGAVRSYRLITNPDEYSDEDS